MSRVVRAAGTQLGDLLPDHQQDLSGAHRGKTLVKGGEQSRPQTRQVESTPQSLLGQPGPQAAGHRSDHISIEAVGEVLRALELEGVQDHPGIVRQHDHLGIGKVAFEPTGQQFHGIDL